MYDPIAITQLDDPRIHAFRNQRDAYLRARHLQPPHPIATPPAAAQVTGTGMPDGLFIAEGLLVSEHLAAAHRTGTYQLDSMLVGSRRLDAALRLARDLHPAPPIYTADQDLLEAIAGFDFHRGLLALGRAPAPPQPHTLIRDASLVIVLEDLSNHDNIGSIFRSASCLAHAPPVRTAAVLLTRRCCDPLYRKALRVSIGHALRVPWAWVDTTADAVALLHDAGFRTWAATPDASATPAERVLEAGAPDRVGLVLGAEGPGLTDATRRACHEQITISQAPGTDSLNVGVAAGILIHALAGRGRRSATLTRTPG